MIARKNAIDNASLNAIDFAFTGSFKNEKES